MTDTTATVRLPDGRTLGYASYGDPQGVPALSFHGTPGSRLLPREADRAAVAHGVRLISVDRPGFGLSDHQPGRRVLDWPADVRALADAVGAQRFALLGISSGSAYVLACCTAMTERVTRAVIVSGLTPSRRPALISDASGLPRPLVLMLRRSRLLSRAIYRVLGSQMRSHPQRALTGLAKGLSASDGVVLQDAGAAAFLLEAGAEGVRRGARGWVDDDHLLSRPWGFSPADVPADVEIELWYGSEDPAVPEPDARAMAAELPGARLRVFEGEGHLCMFSRVDETVAALAGKPAERV